MKKLCEVNLSFGNTNITRPIIVDSEFTDELVLDPSDVVALGLGDPVEQSTTLLADQSETLIDVYPDVTVAFTFTDGTIAEAKLKPWVFTPPASNVSSVVAYVPSATRKIGYRGLNTLGLKLDFKHRCLVRRTMRLPFRIRYKVLR